MHARVVRYLLRSDAIPNGGVSEADNVSGPTPQTRTAGAVLPHHPESARERQVDEHGIRGLVLEEALSLRMSALPSRSAETDSATARFRADGEKPSFPPGPAARNRARSFDDVAVPLVGQHRDRVADPLQMGADQHHRQHMAGQRTSRHKDASQEPSSTSCQQRNAQPRDVVQDRRPADNHPVNRSPRGSRAVPTRTEAPARRARRWSGAPRPPPRLRASPTCGCGSSRRCGRAVPHGVVAGEIVGHAAPPWRRQAPWRPGALAARRTQLQRLQTVFGLGDHVDLAAGHQRPHDALAEHRVVVADYHPHLFAGHSLITTISFPQRRWDSPDWGTSVSSVSPAGQRTDRDEELGQP